jgi:hypothetical protein
LGIFDGLGGFPREVTEEGGQLVLLFVCLGVYSPVNVDGWAYGLRTAFADEVFTLRAACTGEVFTLRTTFTGEVFTLRAACTGEVFS